MTDVQKLLSITSSYTTVTSWHHSHRLQQLKPTLMVRRWLQPKSGSRVLISSMDTLLQGVSDVKGLVSKITKILLDFATFVSTRPPSLNTWGNRNY